MGERGNAVDEYHVSIIFLVYKEKGRHNWQKLRDQALGLNSSHIKNTRGSLGSSLWVSLRCPEIKGHIIQQKSSTLESAGTLCLRYITSSLSVHRHPVLLNSCGLLINITREELSSTKKEKTLF